MLLLELNAVGRRGQGATALSSPGIPSGQTTVLPRHRAEEPGLLHDTALHRKDKGGSERARERECARVASLSFSVIVNRCNLLQARPEKQNNPISQLSCFPLVSRRSVSEAIVGERRQREEEVGGGGWRRCGSETNSSHK